jgi:hypothetical protein
MKIRLARSGYELTLATPTSCTATVQMYVQLRVCTTHTQLHHAYMHPLNDGAGLVACTVCRAIVPRACMSRVERHFFYNVLLDSISILTTFHFDNIILSVTSTGTARLRCLGYNTTLFNTSMSQDVEDIKIHASRPPAFSNTSHPVHVRCIDQSWHQ